jgi:hypothetical protein
MLVLAALLLAGCGATGAGPALPKDASSRAVQPVAAEASLGVAADPAQVGFGSVRPLRLSLGGDPTGGVSNLEWHSWGDATATATGVGYYFGPSHQVVAQATAEPAVVAAFDLGPCHGQLAYRSIQWFFPGQEEQPTGVIDICPDEVHPGSDQ